ncbi:MAG: hypothetical protein ACXVCI_12985, partial [Bdellovibrionota bacterium]
LNARAENCADIKSCAKLMYDLKGQRYIWDAKMDEHKFVSSPDVEMTKDTADQVFTALLDQLELARVPVGDGKTYRVIPSRLRREQQMPVVEATFDKAPELPNTWDWVEMRYSVKAPEIVKFLESEYKPNVPREARLQSDENSGVVIVAAPAPVVRQMYETIQGADRPLSAALRQKMKDGQRRRDAEVAALLNGGKAKN